MCKYYLIFTKKSINYESMPDMQGVLQIRRRWKIFRDIVHERRTEKNKIKGFLSGYFQALQKIRKGFSDTID